MSTSSPGMSPGGGFEGIVFDMDGVIVDSETAWHEVRRDYVARRGGRWTEEDQRAVMGANSEQWAGHIKRRFPVSEDIPDIIREVIELLEERYERDLPLMGGAREAIQSLAARYPLAVASSSPRPVIEFVLERTGLRSAFRAYVSSDEVERGKPEPDVYLLACRRLSVSPQRSAAVEDSGSGIRAAKAAGLVVVAVPNLQFPPDPECLEQADAVVDNVELLTPGFFAELSGRVSSLS